MIVTNVVKSGEQKWTHLQVKSTTQRGASNS
jgi:hypothetical protein